MSTLTFEPEQATSAADDFAALEQRILRAVALLKAERSARLAAEDQVAELRRKLDAQAAEVEEAAAEIESYKSERDLVRVRIERLLRQLDELAI